VHKERDSRLVIPDDSRVSDDRGSRRAGMEKDVVCGMQVDPAKAAGKSEYQGKTYYFCSPVCKKKFDANPSQYAR
jgi:YHS domain-containing protein